MCCANLSLIHSLENRRWSDFQSIVGSASGPAAVSRILAHRSADKEDVPLSNEHRSYVKSNSKATELETRLNIITLSCVYDVFQSLRSSTKASATRTGVLPGGMFVLYVLVDNSGLEQKVYMLLKS